MRWPNSNWISIHLMLLFIIQVYMIRLAAIFISIHLMLLFIRITQESHPKIKHFNTSHVTVYLTSKRYFTSASNISIHLMLLFIELQQRSELAQSDFNTSHVTVYPSAVNPPSVIVVYFNTSHVTVYLCQGILNTLRFSFQYISCYCLSIEDGYVKGQEPAFQYISCYCLSILDSGSEASSCDFNTSHVTVYQATGLGCATEKAFQYISCYCLSLPIGLLAICKVFQYISCYCLSTRRVCRMNTYPYFNTSHVTVYRCCPGLRRWPHWISIHLMLLFISITKYLSLLLFISIHLMLLFI